MYNSTPVNARLIFDNYFFTILPKRCQIGHDENEDFQNNYQTLVRILLSLFGKFAIPYALKVASNTWNFIFQLRKCFLKKGRNILLSTSG